MLRQRWRRPHRAWARTAHQAESPGRRLGTLVLRPGRSEFRAIPEFRGSSMKSHFIMQQELKLCKLCGCSDKSLKKCCHCLDRFGIQWYWNNAVEFLSYVSLFVPHLNTFRYYCSHVCQTADWPCHKKLHEELEMRAEHNGDSRSGYDSMQKWTKLFLGPAAGITGTSLIPLVILSQYVHRILDIFAVLYFINAS